jgi:tripartite-type tricarboxylate transporter receptor subunit TctC
MLIGLAVAVALGAGAPPAAAQDYPSKPVKMIVPSSAGGITDFVGRLAADYLSRELGQPVVVENRAGAGGVVGMEALAKSPPDGYTLGSANTGDLTAGFLHKNLSFDPLRDLTTVAIVADAPQLLVVNSQLPVTNFQEFIAYAKAHPGKVNYGSAGKGSLTEIGAELLARRAGLQLVHIPYRGAIPAITDMVAGRVQMMHISLNPTIAHIRAGTLRPILVVAKDRWIEHLPDVPTSAEVGLPGYEMGIWFGLVAPTGTPKPIVERLNRSMRAMVADPAVRKRMIDGYLRPVSMSPEQVAAFVANDAPRWERIIRESGASAD